MYSSKDVIDIFLIDWKDIHNILSKKSKSLNSMWSLKSSLITETSGFMESSSRINVRENSDCNSAYWISDIFLSISIAFFLISLNKFVLLL